MEYPNIVQLAINTLLNLIPIFKQYHTEDTRTVEFQDMMQSLASIVSMASSMCDTIRQNNKTMNTITQQLLEQKKRNEDKLKWYMSEIDRVTDSYKLRLKTHILKASIDTDNLFEVLYDEFSSVPGNKYVYKRIVQNII